MIPTELYMIFLNNQPTPTLYIGLTEYDAIDKLVCDERAKERGVNVSWYSLMREGYAVKKVKIVEIDGQATVVNS